MSGSDAPGPDDRGTHRGGRGALSEPQPGPVPGVSASSSGPVPAALLAGPDAGTAREALGAVVRSLAEAPAPDHPGDLALQALLAAYVRRDPDSVGAGTLEAAAALPSLDDAIALLGEADLGHALHRGFTEVAWVVAHLRRGDPDLDEMLAPVDEALLSLLAGSWEGPFDLAFGLAGIGTYALERWPGAAAGALLDGAVRQLDALAEPSGPGRALRTPPSLADLYGVSASLLPAFSAEGYFELGMAHGAAGAVSVLSRAVRAGAGGAGARRLLAELAAWLAAAANPPGAPFAFPGRLTVGLDAREDHRRASWCKGDPGLALALIHAGRALERDDLRSRGLEVARRIAALPAERSGVSDACLCHGALGLAHLFRRFHEASGEAALREAAVRWTLAALRLREPGRGTGGFVARFHRDDGSVYEAQDSSFLSGAVGIGLALAAALSPVDPGWDALLLANPGGAP
jgi:hypothetical protein